MQTKNSDLYKITLGAESDFLALKKARIFITGGTGYIGRWLLDSLCYANTLLSLDIRLTVLSRSPINFVASNPELANNKIIEFITGDIRTFEFPAGEYTHAIHAATDVIAENSPLDTFDVTNNGTRRVLDFCQQRQIENILLLSSGAVYGPIPHNISLVPETYLGCPSPGALNSAYGIGKIVSEWLGNTYSSQNNLSFKSARIFAQVGPHLPLDKQFAAGNFILNTLQKSPILIKGDGSPLRSYMYSSDLVIWLLRILSRGESGKAYNVGSDYAISISDLAKKITQIAGTSNPEIIILGTSSPDAAPERYVPDISRAQNELGLSIEVALDEALYKTIEWYRPRFNR